MTYIFKKNNILAVAMLSITLGTIASPASPELSQKDCTCILESQTREPHNNQYVKPGLDLLEEVQRTGDIFFPGYWVNSLLGGHRSKEANKIVEDFVNAHPDYPQKLKNKLLEAAFVLMTKK